MVSEQVGKERGKEGAGARNVTPAVNLPKGGGAIRGIGEKFSANPVTGTGTLTVPIAASPGRSNFGPELSLSYDSGSGNGPFGVGFSLQLPAITRKTEKGLPRYLDADESDVFILSGHEDLVPVLEQNGQRFEDRTTWPGYIVHRYRPRIEGLFARIERWTRIDGDVHWRSISGDNVLTVYGFRPDSRIADPGDPLRIFSWLICQSYDDKGNAILYEYASENDDGVDTSSANERNRARSANWYPKRIRYGNRTPLLFDPQRPSFRRSHLEQPDFGAAGWMFELVFDYGENHYAEDAPDAEGRVLADASPQPGKPWEVRSDPFSSYRAAFEVRSYRLCRRVLMFHHFPEELGIDSCLVRSTSFQYLEKPVGSFMTRVIQSGHRLRNDGRYLTRSLPPLDLSYTASPLEDPGFDGFAVESVDGASLANLPGGIDESSYRWLDLDGEGIAGILTQQGDGWFYKANLGNGRLGALETVPSLPSVAATRGAQQLFVDVGGDGNQDLVDLSPQVAGFQERTTDGGWEGFRPFRLFPVTRWNDPNVRLTDLSGDGLADFLCTTEDALVWHPSLAQEGFGSGVTLHLPLSEERGPRLVLADAEHAVYLADLSGDGLSDLVRIRNGEVCYWPNLGYGRFGAKVAMDNAPHFDRPEQFDQGRIRLADTDGSGTSDLIYLGRDGVDIYLNLSGNGWSEARRLSGFPALDQAGTVSVTDFLGRGTACLVWSSPLPGNAGRELRYLDLMCGVKPHLLSSTVNNLGSETRIEYASSTEFYLADKAAGTPWLTKLPFPVQVVRRVDSYDYVSRNRFVTSYSYHHGFYDGVEREFRGFGRVDQHDTEEMAALSASGNFPSGDNFDVSSNVPPLLTRSWFHTGVFIDGDKVSRYLAGEYYAEPALTPEQEQAMLLGDTVLPEALTAEEAREACRALKGTLLRQEVYALDQGEAESRPYSVTESNYAIRVLQERRGNRFGVFFPHARETLVCNYERKLYQVNGTDRADPRVSHQVVLEVDDYGNPLTGVAIGYGRRFPDPSPLLSAADRDQQSRINVDLTLIAYSNAVEEQDAYRTPLEAESRDYELVKAQPAAALPEVTNLFRFEELAQIVAQAGDGLHELPFEDWQGTGATGPGVYRRQLRESRTLYRSNDLSTLLPLGTLESLALQGESYKLALTQTLLDGVYQRNGSPLLPAPAAVLASSGPDGGGYVDLLGDGRWWVPNGRTFFLPGPNPNPALERGEAYQHFFLPRRIQDAFGNGSSLDYDPHDLMTVAVVDAAGNRVTIGTDYRVLQTDSFTDPNGNRVEGLFDTLGQIAANAVRGKTGENLGDLLDGVDPDPPLSALQAFYADPISEAATLIGKATSRVFYDLDRFRLTGEPALAVTLARETHYLDPGGDSSRIQLMFSYSDGLNREIQRKTQAEPGPVQEGGAVVDPRWVASGWTIYNNKGQPVRRYEPFFDTTPEFRFGVSVGVSPVWCYDPLGRLVATLHPDHSYEKVLLDPWLQTSYDVNDTATFDPRSDADVWPLFSRLSDDDYLPTWYALRTDPAYAALAQARWPDPRTRAAEQEAAQKAAKHADTPALAYFDTKGRAFLTIAQNRFDRRKPDDTIETVEEQYLTRVTFDSGGNQRAVKDANGRIAMRFDFDMLGSEIHHASMEAGERWTLFDAMAHPVRAWDSRDHEFRTGYDQLRRETHSYLRDGTTPEVLVEQVVYGETLVNPEANNLRGKVVQVFDQAGVVHSERYDFKGNLLSSSRQYAGNYQGTVDWLGAVPLETEIFTGSTSYDALNRPTEIVSPHSAQMTPSTLHPGYNVENRLERVEANLNGSPSATSFVANIDYDAKGQRTRIDYGNGVSTSYAYDPYTFRMTGLVTRRDPASFPDDCAQPPPTGWPGCQVQNLTYTCDPAGNITAIRDDAQQVIFFRNKRVEPSSGYSYDAVYRLIEATGREHLGQSGAALPTSYNDRPRTGIPLSANNGQAMGRYVQRYLYDAVGNISSLVHRGSDPVHPGWTRSYLYQEASLLEPALSSNRLSGSTVHPDGNQPVSESYGYDRHGNTLQMPHLPIMQWDFNDQLRMSQRQAVNSEDEDGLQHQGERTYYVYNATGERVRKVTVAASGQVKDERLYLAGLEIYRRHGVNPLTRETLHVMDGNRRIAAVETRSAGSDPGPARLTRYQFGNHLGSSALELDDQARVISYEEYFPHGGTSLQAVRSQTETPKRYRYAGMERDEESGLNCHGVRYYASWLGRWLSTDPSGLGSGVNLYRYAANSPVVLVDVNGREPRSPVTFPLPREFGKTQTLPVPGPRKIRAGFGGGKKKHGTQAGKEAGAEGGAKGGVEGGEEGGVAGGKVGGMGEEPRTGGPAGKGATASQPAPGTEGPGTGTAPGTDPGKEDGGGEGKEEGKGKGKTPGGTPGGKPGGSAAGKPGGQATGKAEAGQDKTDTKTGNKGDDSILGDIAALASLIADPDSLYEAQHSGNTGKGSQFGSKSGLISGWLGQVLVVLLVFGGKIKKLLEGAGKWLKSGYKSLRNKLLGSLERKALPAAAVIGDKLSQEGLVMVFGQGREALDIAAHLRAGGTRAIPEGVTKEMLLYYRELAENTIAKVSGMGFVKNKELILAVQRARIEIVDILIGRM